MKKVLKHHYYHKVNLVFLLYHYLGVYIYINVKQRKSMAKGLVQQVESLGFANERSLHLAGAKGN